MLYPSTLQTGGSALKKTSFLSECRWDVAYHIDTKFRSKFSPGFRLFLEIVLLYRMRLEQIVSNLNESEDTLRSYPAFSLPLLFSFYLIATWDVGIWLC